MKKYILLLLMFFSSMMASAQVEKILGEWRTVDGGFVGGVVFSSFRFIVISGRVLWVFGNFCVGVCILWRFCLEWGGERCIFAVLSF